MSNARDNLPGSAGQSVVSGATHATVLPVRYKRVTRALFAQSAMQDGPIAIALLQDGASAIGTAGAGLDRALAAAEIGASVWLLGTLVREARHLFGRAHAHAPASHDPAPDDLPAGVEWPGVAAALLGLIEVWHTFHRTGHVKRPVLLTALVTLVLALGVKRAIVRRRRRAGKGPRLVLSATGVEYRATRRCRFTVVWEDVARIDHAAGVLHLRLRDGRTHSIRADQHLDGDALLAAARAALVVHAPAGLAGARDGPAERSALDARGALTPT